MCIDINLVPLKVDIARGEDRIQDEPNAVVIKLPSHEREEGKVERLSFLDSQGAYAAPMKHE